MNDAYVCHAFYDNLNYNNRRNGNFGYSGNDDTTGTAVRILSNFFAFLLSSAF